MLCVLGALIACAATVHLTNTERSALDATASAWYRSDLPPVGDCLNNVDVRYHNKIQAYVDECNGMSPGLAQGVETAASCVRTELRGVAGKRFYVIHISPSTEVARDGEPVVHEALHILIECTLDRRDVWDGAHTDPRIWAEHGAATVQAQARDLMLHQ